MAQGCFSLPRLARAQVSTRSRLRFARSVSSLACGEASRVL
jgi:hypothetical protein